MRGSAPPVRMDWRVTSAIMILNRRRNDNEKHNGSFGYRRGGDGSLRVQRRRDCWRMDAGRRRGRQGRPGRGASRCVGEEGRSMASSNTRRLRSGRNRREADSVGEKPGPSVHNQAVGAKRSACPALGVDTRPRRREGQAARSRDNAGLGQGHGC